MDFLQNLIQRLTGGSVSNQGNSLQPATPSVQVQPAAPQVQLQGPVPDPKSPFQSAVDPTSLPSAPLRVAPVSNPVPTFARGGFSPQPASLGQILQTMPYAPNRMDPNMPTVTPFLDAGGVPTPTIPVTHGLGTPILRKATLI